MRIVELLTTCFWDLRSQCESQVRTLSVGQRLLDEYCAAADTDRDAVLRSLRENVNELSTANAAINEVIAEVRRQIEVPSAGTRGRDRR